ncbi:MAG: DUF2238 domain-containing protein [Gemmatimonadales bacterium]
MNRIDVFVAVNTVLFLVMAAVRYQDRFVAYWGRDHLEEFFLYSAAILAAIVVLWRIFRRYHFDLAVLLIVQAGILLHYAGGFIPSNGQRLYDVSLLGIRYDKYVHLFNGFAAAFLMARLFRIQGIALTPVNRVLLVFVVLGLGGIVEIVEYLVMLTLPKAGVGGYDNNMQDLIANLCGSVAFVTSNALLIRSSHASTIENRPTSLV